MATFKEQSPIWSLNFELMPIKEYSHDKLISNILHVTTGEIHGYKIPMINMFSHSRTLRICYSWEGDITKCSYIEQNLDRGVYTRVNVSQVVVYGNDG